MGQDNAAALQHGTGQYGAAATSNTASISLQSLLVTSSSTTAAHMSSWSSAWPFSILQAELGSMIWQHAYITVDCVTR